MKKIKMIIACLSLVLVAVYTLLPANVIAGGGTGCTSVCQDLCGTPNQNPCQYTACTTPEDPGGVVVLCMGNFQKQ